DGNFTITTTALEPVPVTPPAPEDVPGVTSGTTYNPDLATSASPTINDDLNIVPAPSGTAVFCTSGSRIKGASFSAVYYCGADGKRYVFPNERIYHSWFTDFSGVVTVSDSTLASILLGGVVLYQPGDRMVKIESDNKVYAVAPGGLLRWVTTEAIAASLYGLNWNTRIDDVPVSFWSRYSFGPDITSP
ncbi:hypothetical protein HY478_02545, partial [Candidatus Uhrbacteria bacterium]|nr:hypothetical protein [Candidatus Uhrbacteria bacterium]